MIYIIYIYIYNLCACIGRCVALLCVTFSKNKIFIFKFVLVFRDHQNVCELGKCNLYIFRVHTAHACTHSQRYVCVWNPLSRKQTVYKTTLLFITELFSVYSSISWTRCLNRFRHSHNTSVCGKTVFLNSEYMHITFCETRYSYVTFFFDCWEGYKSIFCYHGCWMI